uniref:NADH-ubiquinone oxidoreductase chain 5 n=1 Tax=Lachesilla sp. Lasp7Q TaxID=2597021 RepID=A0A8K1ZFY1_9NEOP|nr:NADH dehydrogenase subunit 5 [Lachesilla sp. Lasp7Q]
MKFNSNYVFGFILFLLSSFFFIFFIVVCLFKKSYMLNFEVLVFNSNEISMCVLFDWMSLLFMSFVCLISFVVVYYSKSYMAGDKSMSMFIFLIFCFVMSMMLLIISPNLISLLLGWDGLGLISYCLVIYYQNVKSFNAGMLTAMTNRIGDVMILLGIAWMLNFGSWNFSFYFFEKYLFNIISTLIVIAAMTKSAQIPFSSWLPAAMAAPTPVSSLVHSSTLVTAGVYLLIRFSPVFLKFEINKFLLVVSVLTMFMSGVGAVFEHDLKKIIALSTLSQLGLMISALSLGLKEFAFFHLLTHALFKSLLFMCAGYIIHGMNDSQDIRFMGSVISQSPILSIYFNTSNLALCGMPFLSGFYSKDLILEYILLMEMNMFIFYLYFISIFLTVVYSFRLVYYGMMDELKLNSFFGFNDNDFIMLGFMMIMLVMTLLGGALVSWLIFIDFSGINLPGSLKFLVLEICALGGVTGLMIGEFKSFSKLSEGVYSYNILMEMWFLPYLSTYGINWSVLNMGMFYNKVVDLGWMEYLGGQGLYNFIIFNSSFIQFSQTKNLFVMMYMYMFIMFGIILFLY